MSAAFGGFAAAISCDGGTPLLYKVKYFSVLADL
jgi:hypothetical protein